MRYVGRFVFALASAFTLVVAQPACSSDDDASTSDAETGKPCKSTSDCATGFCLPLPGEPIGGRAVCTRACSDTSQCVAGWICAPHPGSADLCQCENKPEDCDGKDNDCNGIVDDPGEMAGACNRQEGPGQWVCRDARCACDAPRTACPWFPGRACVDTQTDEFHCGACGQRCPVESACENGRCVCPSGLEACASGCVSIENDPLNCGGCGVLCFGDQTCLDASCVCKGAEHDPCPPSSGACGDDGRCRKEDILQSKGEYVGAIAVGDTYVFYGSRPGGPGYVDRTIRRVVKTGGQPEVLVDLTAQFVPSLATDGVDLFYGTRSLDQPNDVIMRCPGGNCGASAIELARGTTAAAITVVGGFVYWLDVVTGEPKRCAVTGCGGAPTVLAPAPALSARSVGGGWEGFIAVDATDAFVGYVGNGSVQSALIVRVPLAGGTAQTLASQNVLSGLAESGDTIWFLGQYELWAVPKVGGTPKLVVNYGPPLSVVANANNVYWVAPPEWALKYPKNGTTGAYPYRLRRNLDNARVIALDADYLYIGGYTLSRMKN